MVDELIFAKTKHGWRCSDRNGRSVEALTKEVAKNLWYLRYKTNTNTMPQGFDMTQFNNKLNLGE